MTRSQAIALITAKLDTLDDESVAAVVEMVQAIDGDQTDESILSRELTPRELALIEQSREDFKSGRTYTLDEARAVTDQCLAKHGVPPSRR